jgi:hypothetical protein
MAVGDTTSKHEKDLAALKSQHEKDLAALKRQHEKDLAALKRQHETDLAGISSLGESGCNAATKRALAKQIEDDKKRIAEQQKQIEDFEKLTTHYKQTIEKYERENEERLQQNRGVTIKSEPGRGPRPDQQRSNNEVGISSSTKRSIKVKKGAVGTGTSRALSTTTAPPPPPKDLPDGKPAATTEAKSKPDMAASRGDKDGVRAK